MASLESEGRRGIPSELTWSLRSYFTEVAVHAVVDVDVVLKNFASTIVSINQGVIGDVNGASVSTSSNIARGGGWLGRQVPRYVSE